MKNIPTNNFIEEKVEELLERKSEGNKTFGELLKESLGELWFDETVKDLRQALQEAQTKERSRCVEIVEGMKQLFTKHDSITEETAKEIQNLVVEEAITKIKEE